MNIIYLLQKEYYEKRKNFMIYAAGGLGVMTGISMFSMFTNTYVPREAQALQDFYSPFFGIGLFLLGLIFTSTAFSEAYSRTAQHQWLMLPASVLEKAVSKFLITGILFGLAVILHVWISSLLIESLNSLIWGRRYAFFSITNPAVWRGFLHYLVAHSVFFLGSIYFRKSQFIKTIVTLAVLMIVLAVITSALTRIIYRPYFVDDWAYWGRFMEDNAYVLADNKELQEIFFNFLRTTKIIYWAAAAPFCWAVTYLRLKEVEAKDAV